MITIPNLSFKTKKYLLCIFLIVHILVFMWRQWVYSTFVFQSFSLCVSHPYFFTVLILVSKHMYTWQKQQGWWSVVWDGKNWCLCHVLICSFVHFYFYVNIYSLLCCLHWCLKYQKKILPNYWIVAGDPGMGPGQGPQGKGASPSYRKMPRSSNDLLSNYKINLLYFTRKDCLPTTIISRPGQSKGLLYKNLCHSFIKCTLLKYLYDTATPQWLKMVLWVKK